MESKDQMSGRVERIYIASIKREPVQQIDSATLEAGKGIVGDRYHTLSQQRIDAGEAVRENHLTLIAQEELDTFLSNHQTDLDYGDFRRSIITSGIDLNALVGKEFSIGEALCLGAELCEPCSYLASSVHRAVLPDLVHKAGLRDVILSSGDIEAGSIISES